MRALVTGAAGFVGSSIAEHLLGTGNEVVGIDCLTDYYDRSLKLANLERLQGPNFDWIHQDLNDADLPSLLTDVDVIFHQAGQPGVRKSWGQDFGVYVAANIQATQRLLEAARSAPNLRRLVYASSSSVYGDAESYPTRLDSVPNPLSPYGVSKLAAEHLCSLYATNFGIPTVSLRYFTVYGPRQRPDMAFTRFINAALTHSPIRIFGDGEQIRDFTYIDDVVYANVRAAEALDVPKGAVLNVAGGSSVSIKEVLEIIAQIVGRDLSVTYTDAVPGDVRRTGGDTSDTEAILNWKALTSIRVGLERQVAWARENLPDRESELGAHLGS